MSKKHPSHTISGTAGEKPKARRSLQNRSVSTFCFYTGKARGHRALISGMEKDPVSKGIPKSSSIQLPRHWDFSFGPEQVIHHIYKLDPQLGLSRL